MVNRYPAVFVFPAILLAWFLVVQAWPQMSFGTTSQKTLVIIPTPTTTLTATSAPTSTPTPAPTSTLTPVAISVTPNIPYEKPIEDHAYVFYATSDSYACSALINFHRLRTVFYSKVPAIILVSRSVSNATIAVLEQNGLEVIRDNPPPIPNGGATYYQDVLLKLRSLRLHQIKPRLKRIQVLDSDQLILKNLDSLFDLPAVDIAAPLAYWLGGVSVTTTLLVVNLSDELWSIVNDAIVNVRRGEYDMDIVNRVLEKRLMVLPGRYCTLNSHWEALDLPEWYGGGSNRTVNATSAQLVGLFKEVEVLHYTATGKPWLVDLEDIKRVKPRAHPLLKEQFRLWKEAANGVCRFNYDHRIGS